MGRHTSSGNARWNRESKYGASTAAVIVFLGLLGNVVEAQGTTLWNPVRTICNLRFGRATVVGDKMYLDGGEIMDQQNYLAGVDQPFQADQMFRWENQHLWELDLSAKFNTSQPPWVAKEKPEDWNAHYNGAQGTLWNLDDGKFYTLGGWQNTAYQGPPSGHRIGAPYYTATKDNTTGDVVYKYELPPPRIQVYDAAKDNWTSIALPSDIHRLSDIGFTQSKRNKVGYTLGGFPVTEEQESSEKDFMAYTNDYVWQTTLAAYDFNTNKFNTSELPDDIGATNNVVLHSLDRVGDEGVLVALSGRSKNNNIDEYRPMDVIYVYNIATSTWIKQSATGDIPPVRTRSCSVMVPAPDFSSYQIYLFSGATEGDIRILDMYVLSVPTFVWTKIDLVDYPSEWPIADMACGLYEQRQFMIVPGENNITTAANENFTWYMTCNTDTPVYVFDTYDWTFKAEFDPENKGSQVPTAIVNLVGGDENGNANIQQPKAGWDDKSLASIFSVRNELLSDDGSSDSPSTTQKSTRPTATAPSDVQNDTGTTTGAKKSNAGAIAGGVVGGLAALALIAGAVFYLRRRQESKHPKASELGSTGIVEGHHSQGAPPYYDSPYGTPGQAYLTPPQELQAYEPQEMGTEAGGYYAPVKEGSMEQQQQHPGRSSAELLATNPTQPPPSSQQPHEHLQPSEVNVDVVDNGDAHPHPTIPAPAKVQ